MEREIIECSFCGRNSEQVKGFFRGRACAICAVCIVEVNSLIKKSEIENTQVSELIIPTPREIKSTLDQYVIGQDSAKTLLSVAVYNHYLRISMDKEDVEVEKSNILLLGSTGCGKTLLAQTISKILDVPFSSSDATTLTEAGYVGDDVDTILSSLYRAAGKNLELAERGIIYLDEVDKIAKRALNGKKDIGGESVQQALLKLLEGGVVDIYPEGRSKPGAKCVQMNTKHILFILGGAFSGLEEIISHRLGKQDVGFLAPIIDKKAQKENILARTEVADLLAYGMIPEFMGRIPILAVVNELYVPDLKRIITEPCNAIFLQYQKLFKYNNVELYITDGAVEQIAKLSLKSKAGARGLRTVIENIMVDIMFDIPSNKTIRKCIITDEAITSHKPIIVYGG